MIHKCDFGCNQDASFKFQNGKYCCDSHPMKCPNQQNNLREKNSGKKLSKEQRQKISESKLGKKLTEEHKIKIGIANRGKKHSEETKHKISEKNFGERNGMFGVHISEETRDKLSRAKKGVKKTKAHRQKIGLSSKGRKHSKEAKRKIGLASKKFKVSKKMREKIRLYFNFKGRKHNEDTKRKLRLNMIKRIESRRGQISPNYNFEACKIIDNYGKINGYDFRHAENGGEFHIKELGYWVDGYDKEKNVVIEVDEPHHFDMNGELKKQDVNRQKVIEEHLHCNFIRIKI